MSHAKTYAAKNIDDINVWWMEVTPNELDLLLDGTSAAK